MAKDPQHNKSMVDAKKLPELRSEEVQEVLGWVPPWILRAGITMLFMIVVALLVGSWFFKYPDMIGAPILVTSYNPPVQVNARVNGKITQLLVTDKQQVQAFEYLAVIENPANIDDVERLRRQVTSWHEMTKGNRIYFTSEELNQQYELGDMQAPYLGFIRAAANYRLFADLNYYPKRIAAIEEQVAKQQQYYIKLGNQYQVVQQQYALAYRQYVRDSSLYLQKMISESEFDRSNTNFLQSRHSLESSSIAWDNANIQIDNLQQSILDLRLQELDKMGQLQAEVKTGLDNLLNAFNTWEMAYVLKTPVDGTVEIGKYWNVNQNTMAGETVCTIIPKESGQIVGKAHLPIAGSGKVQPGQIVNVSFLNFPDTEYGMVRGVVRTISVVPSGDAYIVEVDFPNGLMTTYGKELPFYREMHATAEIITEDLRLLQRLLLPLKKILSEQ